MNAQHLENLLNDPSLSAENKEKIKHLHTQISSKQFSDILDEEGNQYINYVQEGGGVWGVALVGYLYALESFGIRFLRIAGTSAGAINTMMIAALGDHHQPKSEKIKNILFRWNFAEFMDREGLLKKITIGFIKNPAYLQRLGLTIFFLLLLIVIFPFLNQFVGLSNWWYFLPFLLLVQCILVAVHYYREIRKNRIGLFPGNVFERKLKEALESENVLNIHQLNSQYNKSATEIQLKYRAGNTTEYFVQSILNLEKLGETQAHNLDAEKFKSFLEDARKSNLYKECPLFALNADYTIITTDLSAKIKVEFPKMAGLYWTKNELSSTSPAAFVRASMAVPYFFQPMIKTIDLSEDSVTQAWKYWLNINPSHIHKQGIFIDGGSISNFPIDIFHTLEIFYPRVPVFGVRLTDDQETGESRGPGIDSILKSPISYLGNIVDFLRGYNDKTFLTKYSFYSKYSIKDVYCGSKPNADSAQDSTSTTTDKKKSQNSSWLNFYMTEEQKLDLFNRGFSAALDFLDSFNWEKYKEERMLVTLKERNILKEESRNDVG